MERSLPLRAYFAALFVAVVLGAVAGALYVDRQLTGDARADAARNALYSARTAATQISAQVALLKASTAQLAANPQIVGTLADPAGCTLTFQGLDGPDRGHLDIIRRDGTVACSSRKLTPAATQTGYADSDWLSRAVTEPFIRVPARDALGGAPVAIASSPIPGAKGAVVAFADLGPYGPHMAEQYGGGRPTVVLITSADNTVIASSVNPERWIGTQLDTDRFAGGNGSEQRDLEGTMRLFSRATVEGVGWNVYVGEDKKAVLATADRLRSRQLQMLAAGLAVLLLLGAWIYRKVVAPIRRLNGAVRLARGSDIPEPVPVSGPVEVRALAEDVNALTASVHRELSERRRSEARYRDLFENASDLITTADLEGRLTAVNEAFARTTGYSRDELVGKPLEELVPLEARAELTLARNRKLEGTEATMYDSELLASDGRRIRVEVASRLIYEDGQPVGTEAICRDITERLELEEQLRQAQRLEAVGRLAGGIAHDFNNLLTVISGYTHSLLEEPNPSSDFELGQIGAAAERAAILTRQLLAFSRRQVLQPRVLEINGVIEGITPMLSRLIGEDLELHVTLEPELDKVLADPNQVEQVLLNLAVNARDAMPAGGRLTIQTANVELDEEYVAHHGESAPGPHVLLAVSDTGTGMDAETLSHVFEPFFTTKPVGTGTGLGLATVYGIVKQSGGTIWVYSEPGEGTTFKIYLPVTEQAAALTAPRVARAPATGTETILLAEDEEPLRTLIASLLERYGYVVIAASSANEALRIAEENHHRIDLLLTDLIMPELSGPAVAERVSEIVPGVKVLFMSGYADDIVLRNGVLTPGAAFLEKPFSSVDLAAKVRETLDAAA